MNFLRQGFQKLEHNRQRGTRTHATENITTVGKKFPSHLHHTGLKIKIHTISIYS